MISANSRIVLIKEAMELEERRPALEAKLEQLLGRLSSIKQELFPQAATKAPSGVKGAPRPVVPEGRVAGGHLKEAAKGSGKKGKVIGGRSKRGQLTAAILDALTAAGKSGARVGDLAERFGVKATNLFVWFATTGRKNKAIRKIAPGHYRITN